MSGEIYIFHDKHRYRFDYSGQGKSIATTTPKDVFVVPTIELSEHQHWIADEDQSTQAFRFRNESTQAFLEKQADGNYLKAESKKHGPNQFIEARASKLGTWVLYLYVGNDAWSIGVVRKGPGYWLELSKEPSESHFIIIPVDSNY